MKHIKQGIAITTALVFACSGAAFAAETGGDEADVAEAEAADAAAEAAEPGDGLAMYFGQLGHLESEGNEHSELSDDDLEYTTAIFIDQDGINEEYSNLGFVNAHAVVTSDSADRLIMTTDMTGFNDLIISNHDYTITNANLTMDTESDGTNINDFTGKGSAIAVFGDSKVEISDSSIVTYGVGTMPVFVDSAVDADGNVLSPLVTIINTSMISNGGTIYEDAKNQFGADLMVGPPWILGIMGTSRCTNLEGVEATMNVIDCYTASGAWAVLSTDMPDGVYLNVVNSTLELLNADESAAAPIQEDGGQIITYDNPYTTNYGTGYGTYANGGENAQTDFIGCDINVGTYAVIFTGGNVTFESLIPGQEVELKAATGNEEDSYYYTYDGDEEKPTVINSDTFGFMFHEQTNTATICEGTEINSGWDTFLVKSGKAGVVEDPEEGSKSVASDVTVDGAIINNGGILIQVMDDDDSSTGQQEENFKEFKTEHYEKAGISTANSTTSDQREQNFTFTNGDYTGNIYNSSGSDRSEADEYQVATTLNVTLGENATLTGAAAPTTAIHINYDGACALLNTGCAAFEDVEAAVVFADEYQNTEITISEYYDIGHVANFISDLEGANDINITLTDNAVWNVTRTSMVDTLTVSDDAQVVVEDGVTLTVGDQEYTAGTYTAEDFGVSHIDITTGHGPVVMNDEEGEAGAAEEAEEGEAGTEEEGEAEAAGEAEVAGEAAEEKEATLGEQNALNLAQSYLNYTAFSYSGLISQLEFEGFSTEEATYAVDNCGADWNEQAAKCAEQYMDYSSFSKESLISQLEFEGFTTEQAEYGAAAVGY